MSFSAYLESALLGHVFGSATYAKPASLHVALFTAAPGDAGAGTELTGGGYARVAATFIVSGASPAVASNAVGVEFPAASADWGTVTHAAVFDAASGGNMLAWGALVAGRTISAGDIFRFNAGDLDITLD